jgi:hypothetical protein
VPVLPLLLARAWDDPGRPVHLHRCHAAARPEEGESQTDIIILTHLTIEKNVDTAIAKIEALDSVTRQVIRLRLENL